MNASLIKPLPGLVNIFRLVEPLAAARLQNGSTPVNNVGETPEPHLLIIPVKNPVVSVADAHNPTSLLEGCLHNSPDGWIHSRSITPGGQNADGFHGHGCATGGRVTTEMIAGIKKFPRREIFLNGSQGARSILIGLRWERATSHRFHGFFRGDQGGPLFTPGQVPENGPEKVALASEGWLG
jgi:hypothetical protein